MSSLPPSNAAGPNGPALPPPPGPSARPAASPPRPAIRRVLGYLKPYRWRIALGFLCLLLATPATLFHPIAWKLVVDEVVLDGRLNLLLPILALMLAVHFVGVVLSGARTYLLGVVGQRFVFDLRNEVYAKVQGHSMEFFHNRRSGDLLARAVGDVDALQEVAINGVDQIINNILQFLVVSGVLIWLQWKLGLVTLLPLIGVALLVWYFNRRMRPLYKTIRDRLGDVSAKLGENLMGMLVIKAFAREGHERARFEAESRRYYDTSVRGVLLRTFYMPSVMSVGFLSSVVSLGYGAWLILQGQFTLGGLVAYRGYWWQLNAPILSLAQINEMLQRAGAASSRVFELLDAPLEIEDAPGAVELPPQSVAGRLACANLSFAYPGKPPVLRGIDLEVEPGHRAGVVGPSGAGKSTLLSLLLRLYDPTAGRITLDGLDLRAIAQHSLRSQFAVVTQEPFLFADTIRHNIRYGRLDAGDADIEEAARRANAHDFIAALPQGYDTLVGERGVKLSGGQKQRVSIARAFLANPRILLLDEATAAVEPESETIIQAALGRLLEGRTAVIISHRLSMVRDCDQILVIHEGGIAERGTHEELLERDGWYARMYRMQMGEEIGGVAVA